MSARVIAALLSVLIITLSCRPTPPVGRDRPCGAGGPRYAETPADYIIRRSGPLGPAVAHEYGALVVRIVDGRVNRPVVGPTVRLSAADSMFAPADEPGGDTDGMHTFVPIPAGHYLVRIAAVGYQVQTLGHDVRSGVIDTLTVTLLRAAFCLSH